MPNAQDADISIPYLHTCFVYEPDTGVLRRRRRSDRSVQWNGKWAGRQAGTPTAKGYLHVSLICGGRKRLIYAHRIAHAMMTGAWPEDDIDHWDHDEANNRWRNLRPVTNAQNGQHRRAR